MWTSGLKPAVLVFLTWPLYVIFFNAKYTFIMIYQVESLAKTPLARALYV